MATLGSLAIGSKIKISHSVLGDIIFLKADKDHDGYPFNSTTLITEKIILLRAFDAKEPNNSDSNRKSYGNNKYSVSNLDQWLNSSAAAGQWYSARHSADQAPNNANVWNNYNEYDQDAGFLAGFDAAFVAALKDTTLKVALNTVTDGGGYESVVRKFFLPSRAELFGAAENNIIEGSLLSYFSANTNGIRKAQISSYAAAHSEYSVTAGSNWYYWLRTPYSSYSYFVRDVSSGGGLSYDNACYGDGGVRPLCNLDSGISVSDSTDSDGCYTLNLDTWGGTDMNTINLTTPNGINIKTGGKYVSDDIKVIPTLEEKSATPTESAQEIVPSDGHCGISKLNLGAVQTETKTITPTTSEQIFTPTSGKYFKQVICQAIEAYQGTATPAQGEQTINPTSGKFFSSFKVGAIPSDYVIPSGTEQITANGVYDVSTKANVNVNVPSGVEEVATAAAMNALLVEANVGKYYKFTGTTDSNYTNGDLYLVEGGAVTETWVLNSTLTDVLRMYYTFDSTASESAVENGSGNRLTANFESNGKTYYFIGTDKSGPPTRGATDYADLVYETRAFKNEAYRTITFDEPVTDTKLLAWLQANGTKQSTPQPTFTFKHFSDAGTIGT